MADLQTIIFKSQNW